MDGGGDRPIIHPSSVAVIREIYDSEFAHEAFAMELERALEAKCSVIIIEPTQLGDETARWIRVGNILHKTAVICGLGALVSDFIFNDRLFVYLPLGTLSLLCTSLYTVSWQFDPCVKYQVETDPRRLVRLPILTALTSSMPVVLVRKDDKRRKLLHSTITLLATALCAYRVYKSLNQ